MEKIVQAQCVVLLIVHLIASNAQAAQQSYQIEDRKRIGEFTTRAPNESNNQTTTTIIRVAMLVAQNDTDYGLQRKNSMLCNSGGAVTLALERLWREGILPPSVNFSFQWAYEKCNEARALGKGYQFLRYYGADAIIASPCMDVPPMLGHLATNFGIPMLVWGQCMSQDISDWTTYNTLVNIVPNFKNMAKGLMEFMRYSNWTQFAVVLQSDVGVSGGCYEMGQSIDFAKNAYPDIQINYKVRMLNLAKSDVDSILEQIKQRARIVIVCFDDIVQLRTFSLSLFDAGLNTNDYVYVMPDFDMTLSFNLSKIPYWRQDRGNMNASFVPDGRDDDSRTIGRLTFWLHYDITLSDLSNSDYTGFYQRVLARSRDWPFYCSAEDVGKATNGSVFSILLYDAIYNYGLALNESFKQYGGTISPSIYRNGTLISENSKRTFMGMTGLVVTESDGNSRVFVVSNREIKANGIGSRFRMLLQLAMNKGKVNITLREGDAMWLTPYTGFAPPAVPRCGFDDNGCPVSPLEAYKGYIIAGIALVVLFSIGLTYLIGFIIYSNIRNKEQKNLFWQIPFGALTRIKQKHRSHVERSERSIHSGPSTSTFTTGSSTIAQSKTLILYSYNDEKCVGQKHGSSALVNLTEWDMAELRTMRMLDHENLNRFWGLSLDGVDAISVWKYCSRGSIRDVVASGNALTKDKVFVQSIVAELCEGVHFLHNSPLQFHGRLKSSCCLVDERWQVKIAYYGLSNMKSGKKASTKDLLWKAPEQLRSAQGEDNLFATGSKKADIYSLALIFTEVVNMRPCWEDGEEGMDDDDNDGESSTETEGDIAHPAARNVAIRRRRSGGGNDSTGERVGGRRWGGRAIGTRQQGQQQRRGRNAEEILYLVKRGGMVPLRPNIRPAIEGIDPTMVHLIRECWADEPEGRPSIEKVRLALRSMRTSQNSNLMDHVFNMLEQYANRLEEEVEERTKELAGEKKKSDLLLNRMLPRQIADRLKLGQSVEPEHFDCVTVFFSDVVGFAALSNRMRPLQVVMLMNDLYTLFDSIINDHDMYKVESIGDGYLCVSGLPKRNGNQHVKECADMALEFIHSLATFQATGLPPGEAIRLRIGLHSGTCMAGVVGLSMPRYCLFGDTVNTASRMESGSSPNKIHISNDTYQLLSKHFVGFIMESRGDVIIKGKGVMQTFWLLGHNSMGGGRTNQGEGGGAGVGSNITNNSNGYFGGGGEPSHFVPHNVNPMYATFKTDSGK